MKIGSLVIDGHHIVKTCSSIIIHLRSPRTVVMVALALASRLLITLYLF